MLMVKEFQRKIIGDGMVSVCLEIGDV